jgi:hypothetical protein
MNLELVARVASRLQSYAVVGAYALAARGYVRQTADFDMMTTDPAALRRETWEDLSNGGIEVRVRKGDADDPLAGVVRIRSHDSSIDVVVAKYRWQQTVIERAETIEVSGIDLRIPKTTDLILLKLFAGGYGDLHDVTRLLETRPREELLAEVDTALEGLPDEMRQRWERLVREIE